MFAQNYRKQKIDQIEDLSYQIGKYQWLRIKFLYFIMSQFLINKNLQKRRESEKWDWSWSEKGNQSTYRVISIKKSQKTIPYIFPLTLLQTAV
jgi:hypothetical protein